MSASEVIVAVFNQGSSRADGARSELLSVAVDRGRAPANIAVVRHHSDGVVTVDETIEEQATRTAPTLSAIAGWLLGAVGMVFGAPLGPAQGIGAGQVLGTEIAAANDAGYPDAVLEQIGERLPLNSSALIVTVLPDDVPGALQVLQRHGGVTVQNTLPEALRSRLEGES
jgi:uncharacterized membrane protein